MRAGTLGVVCSALLAGGCGSINLWPFGESGASEISRKPANATEYRCDGGRAFYVRNIDGGAVWLIAPDREIRLEKKGEASWVRRVLLMSAVMPRRWWILPASLGCKKAATRPLALAAASSSLKSLTLQFADERLRVPALSRPLSSRPSTGRPCFGRAHRAGLLHGGSLAPRLLPPRSRHARGAEIEFQDKLTGPKAPRSWRAVLSTKCPLPWVCPLISLLDESDCAAQLNASVAGYARR